jgi:peptidoglycan/LPS O-acetylase OafA/YrhL
MSKAAWLSEHRNSSYNKYVIGIIVTVAFLLILATLSSRVSNFSFKYAAIAGAITYPLFLIHGRLGLLTLQNLGSDSNKLYLYPAIIICAIILAYALLRIEKKLLSLRL